MKYKYTFTFETVPTKVELTVNGKAVETAKPAKEMEFTFSVNEIVRLVVDGKQVIVGGGKVGCADTNAANGAELTIEKLEDATTPTTPPAPPAGENEAEAEAEAAPSAWPEPTQPSEPPVDTDPANPEA